MGSTMVGMAAHGGILPVGGTFFVFLDYMRPPVRLSSLSWMKVCFVYTHDSVGVGEDGPTHQPIEQLATLRAIPGMHVIRPADANETAQAWRDVVEHDGPSALVLSRQNVEVVTDGSAVAKGAGIVRDRAGTPISSSSAPAARSPCACTPRNARRTRHRRAGGEHAELGPLRAAGRTHRTTVFPRACRCSRSKRR